MRVPAGIVLNAEQQKAFEVDGRYELIYGAAGSGKTLVLLMRACRLAAQTPGSGLTARAFTYNRALATNAQEQVQWNGCAARVKVQTFHSWAFEMLRVLGVHLNVIEGRERTSLIKDTVAEARGRFAHLASLNRRNTEWWEDEIDWIKGREIGDEPTYLSTARDGRGDALQQGPRRIVWVIYCAYQAVLAVEMRADFQDFALELGRRLDPVPNHLKVEHVLIDEAQDLHLAQLRLLARVARTSLTLAADRHQKIYKTTSNYWKDLGVDFEAGGPARTHKLKRSYRSTKQILNLAACLRKHDNLVTSKDAEFLDADQCEREGPVPVVFATEGVGHEDAVVCHLVRSLAQRNPHGTIGVLARGWDRLDQLAGVLRRNGQACEYVRRDAGSTLRPGVKLTTFHSAKGLEFDDVILVSVNGGLVPPPYQGDESQVSAGAAECADHNEYLGIERRLLYVAMTRSKGNLYLLHGSPRSPYLDELDPALYRTTASEVETVPASAAVAIGSVSTGNHYGDLDPENDLPF